MIEPRVGPHGSPAIMGKSSRKLAALVLLGGLFSACLAPPMAQPAEGYVAGPTLLRENHWNGVVTRVVRDPTVVFTPPAKLNAYGYGYEPSIEVGPDGTVYVTAHKATIQPQGTRASSWLWFSRDGGHSWRELPSPAQFHDKLFALEGDLGQDASGRIYYVDTYVPENHLSRWSTTPDGPRWDFTRPFQGTVGLDDRPWLSGHGDGIVYYLGADEGLFPPPNHLLAGNPTGTRYWLYASVDGGMTWTLGHGFEASLMCSVAADRRDDHTVTVGCMEGQSGTSVDVVVHRSTDRGATLATSRIARLESSLSWNHVGIASHTDGALSFAWQDDDYNRSEAPGRLVYAHSRDGASWRLHDLTPFEATFGRAWAAAGDPTTAGVAFYATNDTSPDASTTWKAYALVSHNVDADVPTWALTRLQEEDVSVARGGTAPGDFFQSTIGPDNELQVAYQKEYVAPSVEEIIRNCYGNDILHVRQVSGPNMAGGLS